MEAMPQHKPPVLVWFRRDLRLADNPALYAAAGTGSPVIPVLIKDECQPSPWLQRGVSTAWQALNARALDLSLKEHSDARLIILNGTSLARLLALAEQIQASAIYLNSLHEPAADAADEQLRQRAGRIGVAVNKFTANLLMEPGSITTADGGAYKVFTPFHRQFVRQYRHAPPLPEPERLRLPASWPASPDVTQLCESSGVDHLSTAERWKAGEAAAQAQLGKFLREGLESYAADRDRLAPPATSAISPYLQTGAISVRQVWDAISRKAAGEEPQLGHSASAFLRQLVWREFSYHVLSLYPDLATEPYRREFARFPWAADHQLLECWRRGETGYPVVDASLRQLNECGWMHGRARMIVASFLIKHLLQNWTEGESWFREQLIDADLACNSFNWQWVAGCGFDAAPYFRIFNPITQGRKFDPHGAHVRKNVPEIAGLPDRYLFEPFNAPQQVLRECGIELGKTYPQPLVEHKNARERALAAYYGLKNRR